METLLTYKEALAAYGSRYRLNGAIEAGQIHRIARNLYSTNGIPSILDFLSKRFPEAIVTDCTALYLHGFVDFSSEKIDVATKQAGTKIVDERFHQTFIHQDWLHIGETIISYNGIEVRIFDLERMLLELMRSRNKVPFDIYKEAVASYRRITNDLDVYKLQDYARIVPRGESYLNRALEIVF